MEKSVYNNHYAYLSEEYPLLIDKLNEDYQFKSAFRGSTAIFDLNIEDDRLIKLCIFGDIITACRRVNLNIDSNTDEKLALQKLHYLLIDKPNGVSEYVSFETEAGRKFFESTFSLSENVKNLFLSDKTSYFILKTLFSSDDKKLLLKYYKFIYDNLIYVAFASKWVSTTAMDYINFLANDYENEARDLKDPKIPALFRPTGLSSNPSKHLKFCGIEINGKANTFGLKLVDEGFNTPHAGNDFKSFSLYGDYSGYYPCFVYVQDEEKIDTISRVDVILPKEELNTWSKIEEAYYKMKSMFTHMYGYPACKEEFEYPYYYGDGDEFDAMKNNKCHYISAFFPSNGIIRLFVNKDCLMVAYIDKINNDLVEGK